MAADTLTDSVRRAWEDLTPHIRDFDSVVCGGDHHGIALAAAIASVLEKPLMIVCMTPHDCVVSHITCIGDVRPVDRFLYVDDFFSFGATKKFVFDYFAQSGEPVPVVATYAATTREYKEIPA